MKRVISFLLSIVMMFSIVSGINFNVYAAEGSDYLSEDDIMWFTNKFLYTFTESEKAAYGDVLKKISPNVEWSGDEYEKVKFCVDKIQCYWSKISPFLPATITDNDYVKLGNNLCGYFSCTIGVLKNAYYITNEDTNNIQKAYHYLKSFNSICSTLGWSLGPLSPVLAAVEATLPIAEILYSSVCQESLGFYEYQLMIEYWDPSNSTLTTPNEAMVQPAFKDLINDQKYVDGLNAIYIKYSLMQMADEMKNITISEPINEKCNFRGHTYQVFDISKNWTQAEEYCKNLGGHLVTITDSDEQEFVSNLVKEGAKSTYWLGGTDIKAFGQWEWITGEAFNYVNWAPGEPTNGSAPGPEYYLEMIKSNGKWNDGELNGDNGIYSLSNHGLICEWDNYIDPFPTMNDEHYYEQTVMVPTCITDGYTINRCTDCELEYYSNNVSKLGHNYKLTKTVPPTCTAQGYDLYTCIRCDSTEKRNMVSSLGHNYQYQNTVLPTCASQGYDTYKCSRCTVTEKRNTVSANGHKYSFSKTVEPTCTAQGYDLYTCLVCNSTEKRNTVSSTGHNYEVTSNTATCTDAGVKTTVCSKCGDIKTSNVSALGHSYNKVYTAPTCTESGGYTNTCTRCGDITYNVYEKSGHDYGECVGQDYINKISGSTISAVPNYFNEFYHTSSSIGSTSQVAFSSTNIAVPIEVRLNINNIEKIVDYKFAVYGGLFSRKSCSGIFAYDKNTGREPEQSAIPYTDKDGNLVNMKYVDYKVDGEWVNGEYTIDGNNVIDVSGTVVSTEFTDTRPHIVYTRNEAITNGILNSDDTVNVSLEIVEYQGISFSAGIPGVYFSSGRITSSNSRRFIDVFVYDENANNSIGSGKYDIDICFYNTSNSGLASTTFKIYDNSILQKQTGENEYELTCIDCGEKHTETVDKSALIAVQDKFAEFSSEDYSTKSFEKLQKVCESYKYIENSYVSQEKCDAAVTEILEAIYDLEPYLNFTVSAENGSYEVTCDGSTTSNNKYSLLFGTEITLSATANEGYDFIGWYDVTNNLYFSKESSYTFRITSNTNLKAVCAKKQSAALTFTTYSNWVQSTVTKTVEEWNGITSIDDLLPEVPYRYGYSNGRWVYDNDEVLAKLRAGEGVFLIPEYDEDDTSLPTPRESENGVPALDLYYKLDADSNVGSFVMAAGIPDNCRIESVGIAFYYKKANEFDPTNFELLNNNKMLVGRFNTDEIEDIYIVNMNKFTSTYNWAVRGYVTYYDANDNLKTAYSNQVNIVNREQV